VSQSGTWKSKKIRIEIFRETNGNHSNDPTFRNSSKQSSSAALSDTSPSPPSNLQNSSSTSSLNPQQDDDEQRQKREIAKRREEDRKRREVRSNDLINRKTKFCLISFSVKHLINHYHLIVMLMSIFHLWTDNHPVFAFLFPRVISLVISVSFFSSSSCCHMYRSLCFVLFRIYWIKVILFVRVRKTKERKSAILFCEKKKKEKLHFPPNDELFL